MYLIVVGLAGVVVFLMLSHTQRFSNEAPENVLDKKTQSAIQDDGDNTNTNQTDMPPISSEGDESLGSDPKTSPGDDTATAQPGRVKEGVSQGAHQQ